MTWAETADRTLKAAIGTFKTAATYTPSGGSPTSLDGVFNHRHMEVDPNTGVSVDTAKTTFGVRLADLPETPTGSASLVIPGKGTFRVNEVIEDGEGGAELVLEKTD